MKVMLVVNLEVNQYPYQFKSHYHLLQRQITNHPNTKFLLHLRLIFHLHLNMRFPNPLRLTFLKLRFLNHQRLRFLLLLKSKFHLNLTYQFLPKKNNVNMKNANGLVSNVTTRKYARWRNTMMKQKNATNKLKYVTVKSLSTTLQVLKPDQVFIDVRILILTWFMKYNYFYNNIILTFILTCTF